MIKVGHPRILTALVSMVVGVITFTLASLVGPLNSLDGTLLKLLSGKESISGSGTASDPWVLEKHSKEPEDLEPVRILYIDEDPNGFFDTLPPPPTDLMVMMARLQDAGVTSMGIGYPIEWPEADTLALETMRDTMDSFDHLVLGFAVKDSSTPTPVPTPFLSASIPINNISGDSSKLPIVNRVRGTQPELGGKKTWGAFLRLESESIDDAHAYTLARWSDRVILSLPLALEAAHRNLDPTKDIQVRLGEEIRLGPDGLSIPIDAKGKMSLNTSEAEALKIQATKIISGEIPGEFYQSGSPLYLTDERLIGEKANRLWSEKLTNIDNAIRGAPTMAERAILRRPNAPTELAAIMIAALIGGIFVSTGRMPTRIIMPLAFFGAVIALLAALIQMGISPSPVTYLMIPVVALLGSLIFEGPFINNDSAAFDNDLLPEKSEFASHRHKKHNRKRLRSRLSLSSEKDHDAAPESNEPEADHRKS